MKPILMSIKQEYADQIMDGTKTVEYRKRPIASGATVVVYRSGTENQRGIVGTFVAGGSTFGTPEHLYLNGLVSGISLTDLQAYAMCSPLYRIEIEQVEKFWKPLPLSAIGVDRAPQSWQWTTGEMVARLREMAEVPF